MLRARFHLGNFHRNKEQIKKIKALYIDEYTDKLDDYIILYKLSLPKEITNLIMSYLLNTKYLYYVKFNIRNDKKEALNISNFKNTKLVFDGNFDGKIIGINHNILRYKNRICETAYCW